MFEVQTHDDEHWTWILKTADTKQEHDELIRAHRQITGKYLFFSTDRQALINLAKEEINEHGFQLAKVPLTGKNIGAEYVLCLYFKDDSRKMELADRRGREKGVRYRYWKTDADTLAGNYSQEFLKDFSKTGMNLDDFKVL